MALLRSDVVNIGGAKLLWHSEPPDLREIDRSWELVRRNAPSQATISVVSAELWCNLRAVACADAAALGAVVVDSHGRSPLLPGF